MDSLDEFTKLLGEKSWLKPGASLEDVIRDLWERWHEPHRYWHGPRHLFELLDEAQSAPESLRFPLILATAFHDAIYDPRRTDNEPLSAQLFLSYAAMGSAFDEAAIVDAIEDTATGIARNPLSELLLKMDRRILVSRSLGELSDWEGAISREYQLHPWPDYVAGRCRFLRDNQLFDLAEYVESKRPRIGIYAGSFDPFHQGHLDILLRAEELFDKVIVAVGINPDKKSGSVEERLNAVRESLPFHEVRGFGGLLIDLVGEISAYADTSVVRGLRDGYDLQQEINQARFLEDLSPRIRTVWIPCDRRSQHISSTAIRALRKFGSEAAAGYLPDQFRYASSFGR